MGGLTTPSFQLVTSIKLAFNCTAVGPGLLLTNKHGEVGGRPLLN